MYNYHDTFGRLPAAAVRGKDGKPLLSWRVSLLPFIEQQALYEEFKLDEAWDSPHNVRLLEKMPHDYAPPPGKRYLVPPYHTVVHVFVGKGTAFEGPDGLVLSVKNARGGYHDTDEFRDGVSNTLMIVEAGKPVPWSKPEDLEFDPYGPLPDLRCLFKDGFRASTADASSRFVKKGVSEETIRALITRNGGDIVGEDFGR